MRRSTTLEPNKSLKSLRRPGMSGARDVPVPEVDTIIEQAYHDTIPIALAAPALVHQGDGAGEGRDGVRAGREVDASQQLPSPAIPIPVGVRACGRSRLGYGHCVRQLCKYKKTARQYRDLQKLFYHSGPHWVDKLITCRHHETVISVSSD